MSDSLKIATVGAVIMAVFVAVTVQLKLYPVAAGLLTYYIVLHVIGHLRVEE
jgi:hypothetical protein